MSEAQQEQQVSGKSKPKYRIGKTGRVVVMRLNDGDDLRGNIIEVARDEDIGNAVVYVLGGLKGGRVVVGPKEAEAPIIPLWREITEPHEIIAIGTIFKQDNHPALHIHGAFGRGDSVKAGCLRELSDTFLVAEVIIMEIEGINATREIDPATGFALLKL